MTDLERLRAERDEVLRQARATVEGADNRELRGEERRALDDLLRKAADLLDEIRRIEAGGDQH